ncbi:rhamnogalacturonan acetylesterase [Streptomyces sp. VRA16 Mangrove soil]|uniref:rhamnogalacturonan acetylesterase n=1 Tax=Streptomyces sp. VRA16 Mangrove soil TaxID=2817434 RepID=UPI001A9FBFCC|nr:rhamnogalacturonan acetylesterase [Streptomyces sp. VRA16 Mangrove soil]MBO1335446.1 rhamnogalacturonan acetylesterase [Streptomyces sp. VRA16 Mangrove soil]
MRRAAAVALAVVAVAGAGALTPVSAAPAASALDGLANCTTAAPLTCHFDVPPGDYDVRVELGGATAGSTSVRGETRRALLAETATEAGRTVHRSFTVNVRTPEGEPTGAEGSDGLDLTFGGSAPELASIQVKPARPSTAGTRRILLIGDSTVCDQPAEPYTGWGQELPQFLKKGVSVANYADSGESSVTYLENPALFPTVQPLIGRGDLVLIQLAHNDKTTDEATYRADLKTLVDGVRAQGGRPVLVTPIVRRWFNADGTLNNDIALLVNGLGVNHPAVIRELAATEDVPLIDLTALTKARVEELGPEGSKALYLYNEKKDNTHTSVRGATEYAQFVRDALRAQGLVPPGLVR